MQIKTTNHPPTSLKLNGWTRNNMEQQELYYPAENEQTTTTHNIQESHKLRRKK